MVRSFSMAAPTELLNTYVSRVRSLFSPPTALGEDRGAGGPASSEEIAARAQDILEVSADLTRAEQEQLADPDPLQRSMSAERLLAKAATELEISAYLKEPGRDEEDRVPQRPDRLHDRGIRSAGQVEDFLEILTGNATGAAAMNRGAAIPSSLEVARQQLSTESDDACDLIVRLAGETGKPAFAGLLGLGLTDLAQAAGTVISSLAGTLGVGAGLTKLYDLCRDFVVKAYQSILALIGDDLAKKLTEKLEEWLKGITGQHLFGDWLRDHAYKVNDTKSVTKTMIRASNSTLPKYALAIDAIHVLTGRFDREMGVTKKLIRGLGFVKYLPGVAGPQALLLQAGGYGLILAWIYYDGADYLDTPGQQLLTRIPGVPAIVATSLA
jgi:hypothetical protein